MTISKKLALGFALPLVLLISIGSVSYWSTSKLIDTSDWVTHTYKVREVLKDIQVKLLTAVSTVRGYIVSGDDLDLDVYRPLPAAILQAVDTVGTLTSDNQVQQDNVTALRPLLTDRLSLLDQEVKLRRGKDSKTDPELTAALKKGIAASVSLDKLLDAMQAEEGGKLVTRNKEAADSARLTQSVIIFGVIPAVVLVAVGGIFVVRSIVLPIRDAVNRLTSASVEIVAGTTQQAASAQEQAAAVAQTVVTVNEVMETTGQSTERAKSVAESAKRAVEVAKSGRHAVENNIAAMSKVREQVESIAENMLTLAARAQVIGEINATVSEIAERTNLLALNAAIEASRAGEHGRGFAVVAGEVKALAEQSKKATAQVRQILGEVQQATNTAVMSTEQGTKAVAAATEVVGQADETIKTLADTVAESARAASQIVASAGQQASGVTQINQAMRNIDAATKQTLASTRQAEQAAHDLNAIGTRLTELIEGNGTAAAIGLQSRRPRAIEAADHG